MTFHVIHAIPEFWTNKLCHNLNPSQTTSINRGLKGTHQRLHVLELTNETVWVCFKRETPKLLCLVKLMKTHQIFRVSNVEATKKRNYSVTIKLLYVHLCIHLCILRILKSWQVIPLQHLIQCPFACAAWSHWQCWLASNALTEVHSLPFAVCRDVFPLFSIMFIHFLSK